MTKLVTTTILFILLSSFPAYTHAQPEKNDRIPPVRETAKVFKVLTNGKRITIKANEDLKTLIVWTTSGHRIIEQKDINAPSYTFQITVKEKIFYVLAETVSGKRGTEKVGIR